MRKCEVDGCGKKVMAKGWCSSHYKRWYRHGDPLAGGVPRKKGRLCSIEGCGRPYEGKSYCKIHYQRFNETGDPLRPCKTCGADTVKLGDKTYCSDECRPYCRIENCQNKVSSEHDVCRGHYKTIQRRGGEDPSYTWAMRRECTECGKVDWPENGRRSKCSAACAQIAYQWEKRSETRPVDSTCVLCGESFSRGDVLPSGRRIRSDSPYCVVCSQDASAVRRYRKHGVTVVEYAEALGRGCPICRRIVDVLVIDHDHDCCDPDTTRGSCENCRRLPLCSSCNIGLGLLGDESANLKRAAEYLESFGK